MSCAHYDDSRRRRRKIEVTKSMKKRRSVRKVPVMESESEDSED